MRHFYRTHLVPVDVLGVADEFFPALGLSQTLKTIASLCDAYPNSAEMFASYLKSKLNIGQIGYFERICESAVQYAERLLAVKPFISTETAQAIAQKLVYEYKDHGFVIDLEEARKILGPAWIKDESSFLFLAEALYRTFEVSSFLLDMNHNKAIEVIGSLQNPEIFIWKTGD